MKYEIEIDETLMNGWKPIAFRTPKDSEYYVSHTDIYYFMPKIARSGDIELTLRFPRLIIEPPSRMEFRFVGHTPIIQVQPGQFYKSIDSHGSLICAHGKEILSKGTEIWEKVE